MPKDLSWCLSLGNTFLEAGASKRLEDFPLAEIFVPRRHGSVEPEYTVRPRHGVQAV